jgi:hypothetical protein
MSIPRSFRAAVPIAALAALAACAGGTQFAPGTSQQSIAQRGLGQSAAVSTLNAPAPKKTPTPEPLIFAADAGGGAVYAYDNATGQSNQSPIWSISGTPLRYPTALWVDGNRNLYVGDNNGYIYEYNDPSASGPPTKVSFTYNNLGYTLSHIAVCGNYLYAAEIASTPTLGAAINVFKLGTENPIATITQTSYESAYGWGVTCNFTTGDMYFGYDVSYEGPGAMDEYNPGGTSLIQTLKYFGPNFIQGLAINKSYKNFVFGDPNYKTGPAIEFWPVAGKAPNSVITGSWVVNPEGFAFEYGDTAVWDADNGTNTLNRIDQSKKTVLNSITTAGGGKKFVSLTDVAADPPDHP